MTKPGPKPRPTALRLVEGTGAGNPDEPVPPALEQKPLPPAWLTARARKEWHRVADDLWQIGVLTALDQGMLAAYCEAWGRYEQAVVDLNKAAVRDSRTHGAIVISEKGNAIQNPLFGVVNVLRRDMQRLAAEFGLSPAGRVPLTGGRKAPKDDIADKYFRYD